MKRPARESDGLYHIKGKTYKIVRGSRAQVWNQTAYKTPGGLLKNELTRSHGRIVSLKKSKTAKKEKRLLKAGYGTQKGKFGAVKLHKGKSRKMRGGNGINYALSPSPISGITQTSGVDLQFIAGQGN
jgi:hypothetical protein